MLRGQQQPVIAGGAAIVQRVDRAVILTLRLVLQIQRAALVGVAGCIASRRHAGRTRSQRPRARHDLRVDRAVRPQMNGMGAEIGGLPQPVGRYPGNQRAVGTPRVDTRTAGND